MGCWDRNVTVYVRRFWNILNFNVASIYPGQNFVFKDVHYSNRRTWMPANNKTAQEIVRGLPCGSVEKNPPAMQEMQVWYLGLKYTLEEGMATHSSILAWRIPWTEEPCGQGCKESDTTEATEHTHMQTVRSNQWHEADSENGLWGYVLYICDCFCFACKLISTIFLDCTYFKIACEVGDSLW